METEDKNISVDTEIKVVFTCCIKKCNKTGEVKTCCIDGCLKTIHPVCSDCLLTTFFDGLTKTNENEDIDFGHEDVICSKRCFTKLLKTKINPVVKKTSRFWGNDGPNDFISSMSILVNWMTSNQNYSKWRGGDKHSGTTKKTLASMISNLIFEQIGVERSAKHVQNKIECLEKDYRNASDWLNQTGAGLDSGLAKTHIQKICPLYYDLEPFMCDRASTTPLVSSGTAFEDSDDDSKSKVDDLSEISKVSNEKGE